MEILRTISLYAEANTKIFLVIGGHAINFYGLSRQTGDIDLLVEQTDREWWINFLTRLKYTPGQNDERFARFRPPELGQWPIDLMYVDENTFSKLGTDAIEGNIGVAQIRIVSARHLATLKIHALKHHLPHRHAKDYNDLIWLLTSGKTNFSESELEKLCKRYASRELYERLLTDWKSAIG